MVVASRRSKRAWEALHPRPRKRKNQKEGFGALERAFYWSETGEILTEEERRDAGWTPENIEAMEEMTSKKDECK